MRYPLAFSVVLAIAVGLSAAPIPKGKVKVKDEDGIQGTWQADKFDFGPCVPIPPPRAITQMQFTFKGGGKMTMSVGEKPPREGEYKLDPTAKVKEIDLVASGRVSPGIYELDGDTLKICMPQKSKAPRPIEMKPDGNQVVVITFKRVKEEKKEK